MDEATLEKAAEREREKKTLGVPKHPSCSCFCDGKLLLTSPADVKLCWLGRPEVGHAGSWTRGTFACSRPAESSTRSLGSHVHDRGRVDGV